MTLLKSASHTQKQIELGLYFPIISGLFVYLHTMVDGEYINVQEKDINRDV